MNFSIHLKDNKGEPAKHSNMELSRVQGPLHGALTAKFVTMMFKTVQGEVVLTIHTMKTSEWEELMMQDLT